MLKLKEQFKKHKKNIGLIFFILFFFCACLNYRTTFLGIVITVGMFIGMFIFTWGKIEEKQKKMKFFKKVKPDKNGLFKKLLNDIESYLSIFSESLEEIKKRKKEKDPYNFTDWYLKSWDKKYSKELNQMVTLFFKNEEYYIPQVVIFDNIERKLNSSAISLSVIKDPFRLSPEVRDLTENSFEQLENKYKESSKKYSPDIDNLRLIDIEDERNGQIKLKLQSVKYKDYVHTNLVLDAKERSQTLREYIHPEGKLEKLNGKSLLANNLGINFLLFTAGGSLILQRRSEKEAFRSGELCPSASGTVSLEDVQSEITLEDMPVLREAFEEIGVKGDGEKQGGGKGRSIDIDRVVFLGITRELIRGGEPEMFFFAETKTSRKDILGKWDEAIDNWESKNLEFFDFGKIGNEILNKQNKKHEFTNKIDEFIKKHEEESSVTLLTNLALWVKYRLEEK